MKMKGCYDYVFIKLYLLMKKTPGGKTADESALLLISTMLFFYSLPFIAFLLDSFMGIKKMEFWFWMILISLYMIFLYKINKRYFIEKQNLVLILDRYRHINEGRVRRIGGYAIAVLIVVLSLPACFLILKFIL